LSLGDVEQARGGGEDRARVPSGTRPTANAGDAADIVHHLAQDSETVVPDVERSLSQWRIGEHTLEREIGVRVEVFGSALAGDP